MPVGWAGEQAQGSSTPCVPTCSPQPHRPGGMPWWVCLCGKFLGEGWGPIMLWVTEGTRNSHRNKASQKVRQVGRAMLVHKLKLEAVPLYYCTEQLPSLDKAFIPNLANHQASICSSNHYCMPTILWSVEIGCCCRYNPWTQAAQCLVVGGDLWK